MANSNTKTTTTTTTKTISSSTSSFSDFNSRTILTEKGQLNNDYILEDYRDQVKGQSSAGALAHLLKSSLGSGILAMPMAFNNGGLLFSTITTVIVGYICTHCVDIVVKSSQDLCRELKVPSLSFAETAEQIFKNGPKSLRRWSTFAKNFVDYGLMGTYYSAACVYIVFIATSFHDVINYDLGLNWDKRIYILLTMIPCLLIGQIRTLKLLVPFSAAANVLIVITFSIVLYYLFREPLVYSDKPLVAKPSQIPLYFATVIFAMEGIGSVFPVENAMKKPQQFLGCPGVLNIAMIIVVSLYTVIGFFGYVHFGSAVRGSITLNLEMGDPLADATKLMMAIAILFTYGLQFYIPNEILWRKINHKFNEKHHNKIQIILRTAIIIISVGVCLAIPNLEPFISLVGAIFFSLLGIFVPSLCESVYLWPDRCGVYKWKLWKNILLGIFAICALVSGAAASLKDIIG